MPRKRKLLAQLSALQSNSSFPQINALENLNTTSGGDCSPKSSKYFVTEKRNSSRLEADFFNQPCVSLAKSFLGQILVRKLPDGRELWGRIVETEAYLGGEDEASHSKGGKQTQRNAAMFMKPGTLYVYQIYGIYFCVNVSSKLLKDWQLCNGPSRLCQAFGIDKAFDQRDLTQDTDIWMVPGQDLPGEQDVVATTRIGIGNRGEWAQKPLRFYLRGNKFVSVVDKKMEREMAARGHLSCS
ncbi:DNA-3-methyladenine glycosylase isoform X2 [Neopelma chrysocephalum]|uniref:DNA-3-methyladenine glycosylase isoform X2 n=1 Tax=Neopelma chrysocephalum TaxID=114329 RepID=UPI000FCCFA48|nr:DNA-3-methyladenine glycosylase isoform X2 [Neopelma chrysocephalum]